MNKICVYTCITGNYDNLKGIKKEKNIDYFCFTNNKNVKSDTWKVIYIEDENLSNVKLARKIKILGHECLKKYDLLLWMDAAVTFKKSINDFINYYMGKDDVFVAFKHGMRNSIKEECYECIKLGKETKENVERLLKYYAENDFKDNTGLIESTVFIRRNFNKVVDETMNLWFDMIKNYSHRDQLSFNYCIQKTGLKVKWINKKVFNNEWFSWKKHNYIRKINKYRLYFGDDNAFDMDCDLQGDYVIDGNKYIINTKIPVNSDKLIIAPCHTEAVLLKSVYLNGKLVNNYDTLNTYKLDEYDLFYDDVPFIIISKKFEKNKKIVLELEMKVLENDDLIEVINKLGQMLKKDEDTIKKKDFELSELRGQIKALYNSKSWKIVNTIRKFFRK
ncbi:MAG: DUF616 domain-containing protein [Bacilli bacterium]|nr:DUF616 domain-containing protein [Bacilli bacterium]